MKTHRVLFVKNSVIACHEIKPIFFKGVFHYEHNKGNLIYAIIKANNEDNALTIAYLVIKEVKEKTFGKYFVV